MLCSIADLHFSLILSEFDSFPHVRIVLQFICHIGEIRELLSKLIIFSSVCINVHLLCFALLSGSFFSDKGEKECIDSYYFFKENISYDYTLNFGLDRSELMIFVVLFLNNLLIRKKEIIFRKVKKPLSVINAFPDLHLS